MEAKAALDCVNKVWLHAWIEAFISIICYNNDATTRAYLQHCFANLDWKNLPRSTNKKSEPKTGKRNNKGQLGKDHPVIKFLADLSHQVCTFAKYLYALKNVPKGKSEMNDHNGMKALRPGLGYKRVPHGTLYTHSYVESTNNKH
jgi:hypothetical protein